MLCVSSLAWDTHNEVETLRRIQNLGIDGIECVFPKISGWEKLDNDMVLNYKNYIESYELKIRSAQSLFYFHPAYLDDPNSITEHFERLISYSKLLGIETLVFGSPSLRKKVDDWERKLGTVFHDVESMLIGTNIKVAIEPNAKIYGGDFFYTVDEIVDYIEKHKFNHITTMIDTHNVIMEEQNPVDILKQHTKHINHIHVSEPQLQPIYNGNVEMHIDFSIALKKCNYTKTITYEVLSNAGIQLFKSLYS